MEGVKTSLTIRKPSTQVHPLTHRQVVPQDHPAHTHVDHQGEGAGGELRVQLKALPERGREDQRHQHLRVVSGEVGGCGVGMRRNGCPPLQASRGLCVCTLKRRQGRGYVGGGTHTTRRGMYARTHAGHSRL
jgi:hypothetical protein